MCALPEQLPGFFFPEGGETSVHMLLLFSKIQLVVYYQCCVLIG